MSSQCKVVRLVKPLEDVKELAKKHIQEDEELLARQKEEDDNLLKSLQAPDLEGASKGEDVPDLSEAMGKAINVLAESKKLKAMSDLSDFEVQQFAKMFLVGKQLDLPVFTDYANELLELKISRGRKGRGEILEVAKSLASDGLNKMKNGLLSGIGGLFGGNR